MTTSGTRTIAFSLPKLSDFFRLTLGGSFRLHAFLPSADLPPDLLHAFGKLSVFLIIERVHLPCDAQEELERIDSIERPLERWELLRSALIARYLQELKDLDETQIYLVPEGISGLLGEGVAVPVPGLIYSEHMLDDGKKSVIHEWEDIISVDNLLGAWSEFVRGKRKKKDVQEFQHQLMDNILSLHDDLENGRYRHGGYYAFKISDPKPRDIHKALVRDRLMHHALYRCLYPYFDRKFIADSYSCREEKGTHRAMERFKRFGYKVSRNDTRTCWVLKCDIRKFFASIDHGILIALLRRDLHEPRVVAILENIIGSFQSTGPCKGLPLGNLTSQLLVNIYMNEFDQFAKHKLKAHRYIRYADDFVIFSEDREWLESLLPRIGSFLEERLALELHPKKVSIGTLAAGVDFLGWVHFPDHRVLRGATRRRMARNLAKEPSDRRKMSYQGMLSHGNAYKLSTRLLAAS